MQELDSVWIHFNESNLAFLNLLLGLIMYGIALELRFEDFKLLVDKPRSSITGILSQFILFPFATYLLLWILNPSPGIALGMLLVAACPGVTFRILSLFLQKVIQPFPFRLPHSHLHLLSLLLRLIFSSGEIYILLYKIR